MFWKVCDSRDVRIVNNKILIMIQCLIMILIKRFDIKFWMSSKKPIVFKIPMATIISGNK